MLAHGICMTLCYIFSVVRSQMKLIFSLCRFQMITQITLFMMQIYMMHLLMREKTLRSHELYQNGWRRLCVTADLDAPLSSRTRSGSHSTSYVSDCYALAVSSLCDEPITFGEAQNWMVAII